ncbi:Apoptosis-antagonizing transcription factor,C-terminal [Ostreococcus tauri]|uniref:Apoptosis-antagonizing transcription factor,C-terminal n=1 Tax=Ostreococcus tauri TaxID=70448 RepID=A0A096PB00_OSTTA|nr:Apoptosis-antagonizing transcription factor,C-terminal [Ostreococcus tauri]CEG01860.1 Apoptosis-antagonizing transcription factor,C-terminal [Ostreococcus tauri]|eukprot:XP_003083421.2 Apoptosis-antagonizing transcription factor,C-terminal [Ostreococcus tauri]
MERLRAIANGHSGGGGGDGGRRDALAALGVDARAGDGAASTSDDDDEWFEASEGGGGLRMRGPIEMDGEAYAGRGTTRRAREEETRGVVSSDASDASDASDLSAEEEDWNDAAERYGERDEGGGEDALDARGARARDLLGGDADGDAELARELRAFQEEEAQTKKLVDARAQHVAKGRAVRAQRVVWERALHARIRLQKVVNGAAKLPTAAACRGMKRASPDASDALHRLSRASRRAMRAFTALQTALMTNIRDVAATLEDAATIVDVEDDIDEVWGKHDAAYRAFASYRDSTCDRWHRKSTVSVGGTSSGGSLKAFNQSISQQVSSTMRAPTRLIEKSQPAKRAAPARLGEKRYVYVDDNGETGVNADGLDEGEAREVELYDDVDFYEQLLKELLESGNDAGITDGQTVVKQTKRRKNVDRKASKGRKLRYHVQEPLVNFTQANDVEIPAWAERVFAQLFASHA